MESDLENVSSAAARAHRHPLTKATRDMHISTNGKLLRFIWLHARLCGCGCVNGIILAGVKRLWALAPWHLGSHLNDFRSGSRNLQIHRGKSWPCMHPVWIGVDSGIPVRKLTRNHVIFMCSLAKGRFWSSPVRNFPLESIGIFRPLGLFDRHHAKIFGLISSSRTFSGVRTLAYRT